MTDLVCDKMATETGRNAVEGDSGWYVDTTDATVTMAVTRCCGKRRCIFDARASTYFDLVHYRSPVVFSYTLNEHPMLDWDTQLYPTLVSVIMTVRDTKERRGENIIIDKLLKEKQTLEKKLEESENRCFYLGDLLDKRNKQMEELLDTNDELKERCEENDQRLEVQQNDLKEQQIVLQEFFLSLQFSNMPFKAPDNFQVATMGESTKHLWVLRRHQRNLASMTKPLIKRIIRASTEAGIVSKNIGRCASKCSIASHDCASGFYKALLVSVGTSPRVLEIFLQMMLDEFESEPCSRLCSQILEEVYKWNLFYGLFCPDL